MGFYGRVLHQSTVISASILENTRTQLVLVAECSVLLIGVRTCGYVTSICHWYDAPFIFLIIAISAWLYCRWQRSHHSWLSLERSGGMTTCVFGDAFENQASCAIFAVRVDNLRWTEAHGQLSLMVPTRTASIRSSFVESQDWWRIPSQSHRYPTSWEVSEDVMIVGQGGIWRSISVSVSCTFEEFR